MTITINNITLVGSAPTNYLSIAYTVTGGTPSLFRPIFVMTKGINAGDQWVYHQPARFSSPIPFTGTDFTYVVSVDTTFKLFWFYDANNQVVSNEFLYRTTESKTGLDPVGVSIADNSHIRSRSPFRHIVPNTHLNAVNVTAFVDAAATISYQSAYTGSYFIVDAPTAGDYELEGVVDGSIVVDLPGGGDFTLTSTVNTGSFNFTSATFEIKSWQGSLTTDEPEDVTYFKDKSKLVKTQNKLFINLSNVVSERLEGDIRTYVYKDNGYDVTDPLGPKESKWARVFTKFFNFNGVIDPEIISQNNYFFVLDGFTEPNPTFYEPTLENQGYIPNILLSNKKLSYTRDSFARIHFKVKNLILIKAIPENNKNTNPPYFIDFSSNIDDNRFYIQSLKVWTPGFIRYEFTYAESDGSVYTEIVEHTPIAQDCKYEPYQIIFKNKWGVLESLSAGKRSDLETSIESKDYLRGIVDYNGNYDGTRHTNKQFNTEAYDTITLNTDFIPEYMNDNVKEMLLSNEIWIIKDDPNDSINTFIQPVTRLDSSVKYKTVVNDKLIQYTFKFKFSHNKITSII